MLAIVWEYCLGKAFAAEWADRNAPEWPPHPDRVFQALVAAWGDNGCSADGKAALEWLERQGAPSMTVPVGGECERHGVFVPANDDAVTDELLPASRHRSRRSFPATTVSAPVCLIWEGAEPAPATLDSLRRLCAMVTHVGCATSVVRMQATDRCVAVPTLVPDVAGDVSLRVPTPGRLAALTSAYAGGGAEWRRPPCAPWARYRAAGDAVCPGTAFAPELTVLKIVAGERFFLAQAPAVTAALRATLIKGADGDPAAMRLVSGHEADGTPLQQAHLAVLPLGFIGHEHADGHLLGMALALPRECGYAEKDACLRALLKNASPESGCLTLNLGRAGTVVLEIDDREPGARPQTLNPSVWTRPSARWASVTPIACDRLPPRRTRDYDAWAGEQLAAACARIGLPPPAAVDVSGVSAFRGAPSCREYPPLLARDGRTPRWHVHAVLTFAEAVRGPVTLGAGRYRGYGLCRPLNSEQEEA